LSSKTVRVTVLVDNDASEAAETPRAAQPTLATEHGLALWIESDDKHILFDTGQGPSLRHNAPALGIDLVQTDFLILSHGHYDHTGGLEYALGLAAHAQLYAHPATSETRYSVRDGKARSIGIPRRPRKVLRRLPAERVHWVLGPTKLTEHVGLTGPIPRITAFEDTGGPFYLDKAGWRPDPIEDDMALWVNTDEGLVVCLGCAHSGVANTLRYIRELSHGAKVRAVIGGLHLLSASTERTERTVEALRQLDIPRIAPCHCTGKDASRALAKALGRRVSPCVAGAVLEF
jgi:7,8-dihydropterin-6-yl-methyl-4-(beta-D-ribofuranosyl)aminobenzene 5'-phosphate synthase